MVFRDNDPRHDHRTFGEQAKVKQAEMAAAGARGERNVRHGGRLRRLPSWEKLFGLAVIFAVLGWIGLVVFKMIF